MNLLFILFTNFSNFEKKSFNRVYLIRIVLFATRLSVITKKFVAIYNFTIDLETTIEIGAQIHFAFSKLLIALSMRIITF